MSSSKTVPRRWFRRLTLFAVLLAAAIGTVLLKLVDGQDLVHVHANVEATARMFSIARLSLIACLFFAWPWLIGVCKEKTWISTAVHDQLLARRFRFAAWLIALELILGLKALNYIAAVINWVMT